MIRKGIDVKWNESVLIGELGEVRVIRFLE